MSKKPLKTPDGVLGFNALVKPSAYRDPKNPDKTSPARFTVQVVFSGDEAARMVDIAKGEFRKLRLSEDGTLKLSFNRPESFGAPTLFDKSGKELPADHGQPFFKAGTRIQVAFSPYEYEKGPKGGGVVETAFRLEAVRFLDDYTLPPLDKEKPKGKVEVSSVDLEGLFS